MKQIIDNKLELVFPTKEMQKEIEEYRQEFLNNGEYKIPGSAGLDRITDLNEWFNKIQNDVNYIANENKVPATIYFSVRKSDRKIIGNIQIRHCLNKKLLEYGGHIGDSIRPSERRKGYATEQIRLALIKCKELGINNVLMDCDKINIGSAKSIQDNGGILEKEVYIDENLMQKYWITLKKRFAYKFEEKLGIKANHKCINVDSKEFKGDIIYYDYINVKNKITIPNGKTILDTGYRWIEFYDYNSKIKLSVAYDENKEIIEWYFDIARRIGKENGIPYEDDLYLDVVVTPSGEIILLDEDELKEAYERLEVTDEDFEMAYNEANNLMKKLEGNVEKLKKFTDKYLKEMGG